METYVECRSLVIESPRNGSRDARVLLPECLEELSSDLLERGRTQRHKDALEDSNVVGEVLHREEEDHAEARLELHSRSVEEDRAGVEEAVRLLQSELVDVDLSEDSFGLEQRLSHLGGTSRQCQCREAEATGFGTYHHKVARRTAHLVDDLIRQGGTRTALERLHEPLSLDEAMNRSLDEVEPVVLLLLNLADRNDWYHPVEDDWRRLDVALGGDALDEGTEERDDGDATVGVQAIGVGERYFGSLGRRLK